MKDAAQSKELHRFSRTVRTPQDVCVTVRYMRISLPVDIGARFCSSGFNLRKMMVITCRRGSEHNLKV